MNKLFTFLFSIILFLFWGAAVAYSQGYLPLAPLPIGDGGATPSEYTLSSYISGVIKLLIALGAGLSILFAVIGGTQYVASGISPDAKSGAKERIVSSLVGLALVLSSYLLLLSINPKLVEFNLKLDPVTPAPLKTYNAGPSGESERTSVGNECPGIGPLAPSETILGVGFSSTNPDVQRNLTKLKQQTDKLSTELLRIGASATVNSAYRPIEYQKHLYGVFSRWKTQRLEFNTLSECSAIRKEVGEHFLHHELGGAVSQPTGCSPHVKGTGVDITLNGIAYESINKFMSEKGIDLEWQNVTGDKWHFNLKNPPYAFCLPI